MPSFRQDLKGRFAVLALVVLLVLGVLTLRLWSMQVISGAEYTAMADDNRVREITLDAPRGRILDRNGLPLVTNRATLAVSVARSARDDDDLLGRLSTVLGMPVAEIKEKVSSAKEEALRPRVVIIDASQQVVAYLSEHESEFPGVEIQVIPVREYPLGNMAAHVLGYTGEISEDQLAEPAFVDYASGDVVGKSGAEAQFESALQGDRGYRRIEVDAKGQPRRTIEEVEPIAGRDVVLTIDSNVQKVAEEALQRALQDAHKDDFINARAGAAVALDIKTGEVLAMASAPTYDPSLFLGGISTAEWEKLTAKDSEYPLNNRAITGLYPPASTFKAMTGLAGLQYGVTKEWKVYDCQGRWVGMGEQWPKSCWDKSGHGNISFHNGVVYSCDVVFYEIGYEFYKQKDEKLQSFAKQFGFGAKTGIDLPGEAAGRVPDAAWKRSFNENYPEYQKWLPGDTVNLAIGQGDMLATPLQIAAVYAGIANDGKVMRPYILMDVLDDKGQAVKSTKPEVSLTPEVSTANLNIMRGSLRDVITDGTAQGAFRGFASTVAGKTGTAQVAKKDDYAWFVAYAPANEPRYAVAVAIEQGGHGGSIAGPAAREILSALLGLPIEHVRAVDVSR
ncbi:MAG: penicillin-binding protein 2 [Coriobacteriia bacterium]|nr:penicillin-binding protein 2 [Coriobacteriia bacterium]